MPIRFFTAFALIATTAMAQTTQPTTRPFDAYVLGHETPTDAALQREVEAIDAALRKELGMTSEHAAVGVFDLNRCRLALINPDRTEYGASVPKVGILLSYFALNPGIEAKLDPMVRHELGQMAKASSNEMAAKYSQLLGLKNIQKVLDDAGFYDAKHGGGIWCGKHYGKSTERYVDPVGGHSHGANVRQLVRYFLLLEQGKLVSPAASKTMREIFLSPDVPADEIKFVKALKGRQDMEIVRKWGDWENWHHDCAIITAPGRHYIVVALTQHEKGDAYLDGLAKRVDDLMQK